MKLFRPKDETLESIKANCEKTAKVNGTHQGVSWEIVLGISEKGSKNLKETGPASAFRFNNGDSQIVSIWKDAAALEDYKRKLEANKKFINENLPRAKAEYEAIIRDLHNKKAPKSQLDSVKTPESRVYNYLPFPPRQLAGSALTSFKFSLFRVHNLIIENKAKFERGEIPQNYTVPYWSELVNGFQPLLKIQFLHDKTSSPTINLRNWEPKLGPRI